MRKRHITGFAFHAKSFLIFFFFLISYSSLVTQMVKNPPAMQETWLQSLGWKDPVAEGMATHSSILAWRIPMDRGAWRATVHEVTKSQTRLSDRAQHRTAPHTDDLQCLGCATEWLGYTCVCMSILSQILFHYRLL